MTNCGPGRHFFPNRCDRKTTEQERQFFESSGRKNGFGVTKRLFFAQRRSQIFVTDVFPRHKFRGFSKKWSFLRVVLRLVVSLSRWSSVPIFGQTTNQAFLARRSSPNARSTNAQDGSVQSGRAPRDRGVAQAGAHVTGRLRRGASRRARRPAWRPDLRLEHAAPRAGGEHRRSRGSRRRRRPERALAPPGRGLSWYFMS